MDTRAVSIQAKARSGSGSASTNGNGVGLAWRDITRDAVRDSSERFAETMHANPTMHLDRVALETYVCDRFDEAARRYLEGHLLDCSDCRDALRELLQQRPADQAEEAREYLTKADRWGPWAAAGLRTAAAVRAEMHGKGLPVVYMKDGIIVNEYPDGSILPCTNSMLTPNGAQTLEEQRR
jgi:hypothetical protein